MPPARLQLALLIVVTAEHVAHGAEKKFHWCSDGCTELMFAAITGKTDAVRSLITQGEPVNQANGHGDTALMLAAMGRWGAIVTELLHARAKVNPANVLGNTALMIGAMTGDLAIVTTLLEHGAAIAARNLDGDTALALATNHGHREVAEKLERWPRHETSADPGMGSGIHGMIGHLGVKPAECHAGAEKECVGKPSCRWFSSSKPELSGCHDWDPMEYCSERVAPALRARYGQDLTDPALQQAAQRHRITQGNGEPNNPHYKRAVCTVWCDFLTPDDCLVHPRSAGDLRGVNYGGRFIPEAYLNLSGTRELFQGVTSHGGPSLCDVGALPGAAGRMAAFLDQNIRAEHFERMASSGFKTVRLPIGYWNVLDVPDGLAIDSPNPTRWLKLQGIMPAVNYTKWIDRVFAFAKASGLTVLLDLHGAPGGQAANPFTGCFQGRGQWHFDTDRNKNLTVQAIEELAKICQRQGSACYGIELLNEPAGTVGSWFRWDRYISRYHLRDFYFDAIRAARRHLTWDVPLLIMDWPRWLSWWTYMRPFSYEKHGRVLFSTHVYRFNEVTNQIKARGALVADLSMIFEFHAYSKYEIAVTEFALNSHGRVFDYDSLANWLVHQFNMHGAGSAVWNYDAEVPSWGPVANPKVGARPIQWAQIFPAPAVVV
mmetsp:Transcript_2108/g.6234  ORF Transcript_2108/g.6234 Transcript_2108/m.6234 type:complete len:659 (+) Transcript_2108:82-2058(+)